jgi:hypothetical protein
MEKEQTNENNNNENMDKELLEKFESMEARLKTLEEENQSLKDQLDAVDEKQINVERLAESIQRWVIEEVSPNIQQWLLTEAKSELGTGKLDKDTLMKLSEGIQNWVLNDYSTDLQKWILEDYSQGLQAWLIKELAPSVEQWVGENQVGREELETKINESLSQYKTNKMTQIEETIKLLESMEPKAKPTYQRPTPQQQKIDEGLPKYIAEMPDDVRVKYELASQEVRESIDRRARLYDFTTEGAIEKFWNKIDFDNIQGTKNIYEGLENIQDEKERAIRAQFRRFRSSH